jgi:hypothetical protein
MQPDALAMRLCRVTLVLIPAIPGILLMRLEHEFVTMGFGQNAGCGDAWMDGVAAHYAGMGNARIGVKAVAVDE